MGLITTHNNESMPDILCCIQSELAEEDSFAHLVNKVERYLKQQSIEGKKIAYCEAIRGLTITPIKYYLKRFLTWSFIHFRRYGVMVCLLLNIVR